MPGKTGVVTEAEGLIGFGDTHLSENGFPAKGKPFFCNVLVNRQSQIILEYMGNVVFADKKFSGKLFKGEIFVKMFLNVCSNILIQGFLGPAFFVDEAVRRRDGSDIKADH